MTHTRCTGTGCEGCHQARLQAMRPQLVTIQQRPDPLWMRVVAGLSTADWWAIGTAAVVGLVGGVLVGAWYR